MKTKILSILIGVGALACGNLSAQRMPQDNWYIHKQFRGDTEGGKFYYPRNASSDSSGNIYVADDYNHQIQVFDGNGNFLRKWGGYGTEPGKFNRPHGVHVSSDNKVYVAEYDGDRVQVFDLQGNFIRSVGPFPNTQGQMGGITDVTTDSAGNIYVSDIQFHWIMVFSDNGTYLRQWGSYGSGDGQFNQPHSICTLPGDKIAVADTHNHRVQVFNTNGVLERKFGSYGGGNGQFNTPVGIRSDSSGNFYVSQHGWDRIQVFNSSNTYVRTIGGEGTNNGAFRDPYGPAIANGKVYVSDGSNHRLVVFSATGIWQTNVGLFGSREFSSPWGVAEDAVGNIFISDYSNHRVAKFNKNYQFLQSFGVPGSGNGQFNCPAEMVVGPNQKLYVVDRENHRVQAFNLDGTYAFQFGTYGSGEAQLKMPWGITATSNRIYVSEIDNRRISIFDLNGNYLKKIGSSGSFGGQFIEPLSLGLLPDQTLAVADWGNRRLQILDLEGNFLRKLDWGGVERLATSSDGLVYSSWNYNGLGFIDSKKMQILKSGGFGRARGALAELANGDLIATSEENLVTVWRRTFRTETPVSNNAIPLPAVLSSAQRPGQKLLDLDYRVKDVDNANVFVEAVAFNDGQNSLDDLILVRNFAEGTGTNVGPGIPTGVTRRLTWDIAKDWGSDFGQLQLEILAKDNRGLLNLDFIQMPAVGGDPLLKISRTPLTDSDFLSVWYWLLATEDPGIRLAYGKVFPTNAINTFSYSGANGVPGLVGSYFPYTNFTGTPTVVTNEFINIRNWASTNSPDTPIRWDKISARWTGRLVAETNGNHTIHFAVDDNGKIFMNNSTNASLNRTSVGESSFVTNLTAGVAVPITVEFADLGGSRRAQLYWTPPGGSKQLIPPTNLFTGVATNSGTYSHYHPDATNHFAGGTTTTAAGRAYILDKMGYREATTNEVLRAKYAGTPGTINQWDPKVRVGPDERPTKVNAYNFETSANGTWVVPK